MFHSKSGPTDNQYLNYELFHKTATVEPDLNTQLNEPPENMELRENKLFGEITERSEAIKTSYFSLKNDCQKYLLSVLRKAFEEKGP